jgi:cobalt/nickel transport system permease protein
MIGIENYAYGNRWRFIHPRDKMIFAFTTMLICLFSTQAIPSLIVLLTMVFLTTVRAGVPGQYYFKLFSIPAGFILIGAITVCLTITTNLSSLLWYFCIGPYYIGITQLGISQAILLLARSGGAASCLFFLALTTPLDDITCQLERWKVPYLIIEMMTLIYRFIFVFWEQATTIHTAQAARLGHVDLKTSLRSLGYLISSMFINAMSRANSLYNALVARGYTVSLRVLEEAHQPTPTSIKAGFICFDLLLIGLIIIRGSAFM